MRGVDQRLIRQLQQPVEDGIILRPGIAILEVAAAGAADQQGVSGKDPVRQGETVGIVGVAGGIDHLQAQPLDPQPVAVADPHGDDIDPALLAHHGDAAGAVAQRAEAGDVVGMQVGIHRLHQLQVQFADQLQVAVDPFQHRVDDQRLAAAPAGQQVGVGTGGRVIELPEDHAGSPT
jgi:hypothetical protein